MQARRGSLNDREVHEALNHALDRAGEKRAGKDVTPRGPGWDETKKAQGSGAQRLLENLAREQEVRKPPRSILGWVKTGVEITTNLHKAAVGTARELGQELHEANLRDAQNVAILRMASTKLPKEYVKRELAVRSRAGDYAKKIETALQARPPAEYLKLLKSVQQSAQAGIDAAKRLGIDGPEKLAEALKKDANFANAFESNTAFRHGVRSRVH
jgi:hypothetical protein